MDLSRSAREVYLFLLFHQPNQLLLHHFVPRHILVTVRLIRRMHSQIEYRIPQSQVFLLLYLDFPV